jgi:hypothetical protein
MSSLLISKTLLFLIYNIIYSEILGDSFLLGKLERSSSRSELDRSSSISGGIKPMFIYVVCWLRCNP